MCGIAGAIGYVDREVVAAVRRMDQGQVHRGPDGAGSWTSASEDGPGVAFSHRRLAIIDLSDDASQPMVDPETGLALVFNGEIYNYRELRDELAREGVRCRTESDTEVLLKAWGQWGAASLERLRGMFAFAVWDPVRREVALARDALGIKPLYLCVGEHGAGRRTVLFASELRALLASGLVERRLDPVGLSTYLWHGFVTGPGTIVRGVSLLDAGTLCRIGLDDLEPRERRFWSLPAAQSGAREPEELRAQLGAAVRLRLISDVPLGVFLSGGIDSSAIASLAARVSDAPVHTFNIGFAESGFDESPYARAVAEALGTQHTEVRLSDRTFEEQLEDALASLDQPTFDAINTYFVSRAVREAGITVALAGTGGDELFGGYSSFVDVPRAARWARRTARVPRPLLRGAARAASRALAGRPGEVPPQTRWGKLADALTASGSLVDAYQVSYGLYTRDFLRELARDPRLPALALGLDDHRAAELNALVDGAEPLQAVSTLELATFVRERLLRDTDCASMAVSLEVRVPLLDHEVVDAVAGIETERRFQPLGRKRLLRELALEGLPPELFERPKAGFVLPLERWCRERLQDEVGAVLGERELCARAGLEPEAVGRLWRAFRAGAPGIYWSRVWALYVLLRWCSTHGAAL